MLKFFQHIPFLSIMPQGRAASSYQFEDYPSIAVTLS